MAGLAPDEVVRLLDTRTDRLRIELGGLAAAARVSDDMGLPELFTVENTYRHAILTAELEFVRDLAARIRSGAFGGTTTWRRMHELVADGMSVEEILADPVRHLGEEAAVLATEQPSP
jgi:hypothetical protein